MVCLPARWLTPDGDRRVTDFGPTAARAAGAVRASILACSRNSMGRVLSGTGTGSIFQS